MEFSGCFCPLLQLSIFFPFGFRILVSQLATLKTLFLAVQSQNCCSAADEHKQERLLFFYLWCRREGKAQEKSSTLASLGARSGYSLGYSEVICSLRQAFPDLPTAMIYVAIGSRFISCNNAVPLYILYLAVQSRTQSPVRVWPTFDVKRLWWVLTRGWNRPNVEIHGLGWGWCNGGQRQVRVQTPGTPYFKTKTVTILCCCFCCCCFFFAENVEDEVLDLVLRAPHSRPCPNFKSVRCASDLRHPDSWSSIPKHLIFWFCYL